MVGRQSRTKAKRQLLREKNGSIYCGMSSGREPVLRPCGKPCVSLSKLMETGVNEGKTLLEHGSFCFFQFICLISIFGYFQAGEM